jgi:ankyrin repeat protein
MYEKSKSSSQTTNIVALNRRDLINDISQSGWNALHFSCYYGYDEIVKHLLLMKADVNMPTRD